MLAVLYSITPVHNGNFFWHLRNGIDVVTTGEIRTEDPFTWTRQGVCWIQHEWLAEAAMALSWLHGGESGPVILKALLVGLSVLLAFRASVRAGGDPAFAFLFGAAWLALAQPRWIARPHVFSIFLFSVYLYILSFQIRKPWKLALVLFPFQVLWVNIHAGFVMGIFLASVPAMDKLLHGKWKDFLKWTMPPLVLLAASGIHPNGFRTLEYLPSFLAMPLYKETIREWWSPFDSRYAPLKAISRAALVFSGLTGATAVLMAFAAKKVNRGRTAALAILTASTVFAARNGELLAPAMLAWVPGMLKLKLPVKAVLIPALALAAVPFIYGVPRDVGPPRQLGTGVDWSVYPVELSDLLQEHPEILEKSVLFNTNEVSGYLEYRFGERLPLFMDGRCLIFPESFYREYLDLCFPTSPDYRSRQYRLFQRFGFNLIIHNTPVPGSSVHLAAILPDWIPLYTDRLASVYAKRDLLGEAYDNGLGFRHFDPLDPAEFLGRPLYFIPSSALEELLLQRDQLGTDILDSCISALEFRENPERISCSGTVPAVYTLRCWQSCRDGDTEAAAFYAMLSGDEQLQIAVRILQGGDLRPGESLMGIGLPNAPTASGAKKTMIITALWVTGQQSLALETAALQLDSLPPWGIAQCGMLYSLAGCGETAVELARKALEKARGPIVLERAARTLFLEGDNASAAVLLREALSLSPGFEGARLLLADCLWNSNMVMEASMEYETIVENGRQLPAYASQRLELAYSLKECFVEERIEHVH